MELKVLLSFNLMLNSKRGDVSLLHEIIVVLELSVLIAHMIKPGGRGPGPLTTDIAGNGKPEVLSADVGA